MGPIRFTLLTGATGLLGRILLADLLKARLPVAVLVRPGREGSAQKRIERQLQRLETIYKRSLERPVVLAGELTQPGLGLSPENRRWLQNNCERVLHSGAYVSFKSADSHPDREPFRTNVEGTEQLARFALELGIDEFHQISSAFSCGIRRGVVYETDRNCNQAFSNDYEETKLQSEELLLAMKGWKSLTIYRPSIVIDPTPGSLPMGDRTIYLAFSVFQLLSQRVGMPDPAELLQQLGMSGMERKNIVPVDWVSRLIVQIVRRQALHGKTYHLTHPSGTTLIEMLTAFRDVLKQEGYRPLERRVTDSDFGELAGLVDQFLETFAPYFREDPQFDQTNLLQALRACDEENCPDVDRRMLQEIARQQLRQSKPLRNQDEPEPEDLWTLLAQSLSHSTDDSSEGEGRLRLTLTGPLGGSWEILISNSGQVNLSSPVGQYSVPEIYTSTQTWNQLIRNQLQLQEAIRQGRLLLESQDRNSTTEETVEQLLQTFREGLESGERLRKVSLHGK